MTEQFLSQCGLNESVATIKSYQYVDIVESAYNAMKDGTSPFMVLQSSSSYTSSIINELLENAKNLLLKLCQKVLSALNNLQVNSIRLIQKYQEVILDRMDKISDPIVHETYTFPDVSNYPSLIKTTTIEREIRQLHDEIKDKNYPPTAPKVRTKVDGILREFAKQSIGKPITVTTLKESTEAIVRRKIRGKRVTVEITRDTLSQYLEQINRYKQDKDYLTSLKRSINEEYLDLKDMYESVTEDPIALAKNTIRYTSAPDKEEFLANEYGRYADIHVEMLRLFNGFITIYNTAFNTALNILDEKINDRKNLITMIFTTTGTMAALNTKGVGSYQNPIPYTPTKI